MVSTEGGGEKDFSVCVCMCVCLCICVCMCIGVCVGIQDFRNSGEFCPGA